MEVYMRSENYCEKHGYYPAHLLDCPVCAAEATGKPVDARLGDEEETVYPGHNNYGGYGEDTTVPPKRHSGGYQDDVDETIPPKSKRKRWLDGDDNPFSEDEDLDITVIDRDDDSLWGWLIVKKSPVLRKGYVKKINSGMILGRSRKKANFLVDDEKVSAMHAGIKIEEDQEHFILIDFASSNGTYLNDNKINGSITIKENDEIRIGETVFVLKTL
jgi:hypothetical protein